MSSHVYHEIYVHLNWHTKNNARLLQDAMEQRTHDAIRAKANRMKGVQLLEIGGTDDHVHLALRLAPYVSISDAVAELKGGSSFDVNKQSGHRALEWQRGYGVVSFGQQNLRWVAAYIANQREHHAAGTIQARLEVCEGPEDGAEKPAEAGFDQELGGGSGRRGGPPRGGLPTD